MNVRGADRGGGNELLRREYVDRERRRLFAMVIPLRYAHGENEASEIIDRMGRL